MDDAKRLLQRHLDGELDRDASRSVEASLAKDEALVEEFRRLEDLESAFRGLAKRRGDEDQVQLIMQRMPVTCPRRRRFFRAADAVVAMALMLCIWVVYGMLAELGGIVPLSLVTGVSLGIGGLLLLLAEPLRQAEASLLSRLLRKQMHTGGADVLVLRAAGLAIILGAIWYKTQAG